MAKLSNVEVIWPLEDEQLLEPLYKFDHRKRAIIVSAVFLVATLLEIYLTIEYRLPLIGQYGSRSGMLYILSFTVIFFTVGIYSLIKSKRIEFYDNFVRVTARMGETRDISYSEIYLSRLIEGSSFQLIELSDDAIVNSWNLNNDTIWNPDGTSITLYDLLLPRTRGTQEIPLSSERISHRVSKVGKIAIGLVFVGLSMIVGGILYGALAPSGWRSIVFMILVIAGLPIILFRATGVYSMKKIRAKVISARETNESNLGNFDQVVKESGESTALDHAYEGPVQSVDVQIRQEVGRLDSNKARLFAIFGLLASGSIIIGSYFLYQAINITNYDASFNAPVVFPQLNLLELYLTSLVGFGSLTAAFAYLRSASRNIEPSPETKLRRGYVNPRKFLLGLEIMTVCILILTTLGISLLPSAFGRSTNDSFTSGMVGFLALLMVFLAIIFSAIGLSSSIGTMGPYRRTRIMVITSALICLSLIAPLAGVFSTIGTNSLSYNVRQVLTQIDINISYPNNLSYGFLGPSTQVIHWAGGGASRFFGGERFNTWIYIDYVCCYNIASHQITSFTTSNLGFTIYSISPVVPFYAPHSAGLNISYTLQTSKLNYTGPLYLQIVTT